MVYLSPATNFGLARGTGGAGGWAVEREREGGGVDPITSRSCRIGRIHTRCLRRLNYLGICTHIPTVEIRLSTLHTGLSTIIRICIDP